MYWINKDYISTNKKYILKIGSSIPNTYTYIIDRLSQNIFANAKSFQKGVYM